MSDKVRTMIKELSNENNKKDKAVIEEENAVLKMFQILYSMCMLVIVFNIKCFLFCIKLIIVTYQVSMKF